MTGEIERTYAMLPILFILISCIILSFLLPLLDENYTLDHVPNIIKKGTN